MSTPQGRDRVRIESPSNVGKPSEVYVSGVRSSSTPQISAAAAQRIELTCDADACGAQGAIGYLAINCTDYETRHGGVSVGAVDELNHFSGQMLPVGEAKILGNYSAVEVESADLIRIPSAAGQTITFHCIQDCSEASTAYVGTGCDSNATGFKMAEFGVQTSSVDLVAHWESSHWSTTLDASSLTPGQVVHGRLPGLHYNLCVDPDGAGSEFNFGDTGVRLFVQGAYTPPVPFYGSLTYWYFDADAQHLAPGRSYRICTDLDGRHGPMQGGDTGLEVYVNSVEALEFQSASSASVGLACSGCVASNDTQAPSFDGANSFPAHGSSVSRRTNVVLAFSEAIQLGYGGIFQIWDSGLTASPVYEITVADIYAANAAAGGSLVRENKVYITPATLCNVPASCFLFTNTRSYYVVAPEGTVYDLAGNVLPALNTAGTWQWTTVNVFTDADPPEVAMSSHVEVIDSFAHGFVIFTEDVSFSGATDLELLDCGTDFDCSSTSILTGGSKTTTLTPFVDGVTDLATIRAQKQDFGLLEFRYELPPVSPRRFQLRVPVDYVTDTANPTGLTGPSSIYEITFDVGMPYGQEVLPVTSGTQLFLASHCNSTETETYFWGYSPGVSSPVVTLQSNSGSYSFLANFNTADLAAGVHYEVCLDVDGPGPLHRPGPTGLQLFVSPVTAVAPTTVTQDLGRTVIVTCPTVCSTSTYMYLGIDCEEISSPGVVPETPPFRTRSAPLRSTGTSGEFSLTFDAANLTAGVYYHLCLDVDGSSQTRYYGDSRHTVYISAVAGLRSPRIRWSLTAPLSVACFARPQEAMGWWPENDTEEELMVGVQNFTKNYVNQLHWCNELTTAYLATSCDTAVADGYSNALWSERTQSQSFSGTDHLVVWPDVSFVDEERNETESSEVGYRNDAACAHAATERGYAYWTRRASDNTCWFLTESAPAYASFSEGYTSGMVGVQLWLLRLDTRPLLQGQYYTLCIDLDGYQTISSVATTLLSVYVSPVQAVSTTTVWQALNQNISLECSNCTSSTKLTLSVKCDGTMVVGEIPGEQTLVTTLDSNGDEGMWTAIVDAKTLAEGKHYRVCLELDDLMPMGDTGYRIYVTPLYYVTPSVGSEQFQQIEVACPSAICTRSTEIRLGLLHQSCGDGLLDEVETTWVQVEGAAEAKDLRPSRLRGGLDAAVLSAGRGRGAYFFVVDTRDLEVDQNYRVCIDIDGVSGDVYQPGDAGYLVWKPDTTAPFVFGNGTFNGTLEWNVTEAATYLAGRRLDATEEETREVELSRAEASRWWAQRSSEQQNDESSSKSARLDTSAKAAFVDPEAASSHSDLERRLSFVSPVESLYPEFVFLEPTVESENTSEPSLELLPMRRVNFTVTCSSGGCSTATEVRLALSCGSEGHRSSSPSYTQAVGLAYGAFPSNVLSPSGEAFQANLDVSTLLPGFDYRLCIDLDGYYGSSVPGDSGFSAHGSAISALWPSTLQLQSAQPLRVNCSAASGCSAALRGYLSSSACEARTDGLQSALSGVRTESVPASLVGDNSYELIFNTESLTVGQHYRLCVDFDGIGAVQGFGAVGIVYLSDTLASVTTALPFGATTAELQLSCPACTSSSSLMLALDCGDRVDVTNAASSLGVVSSSFAALSGTSWSAHFDTTTLTPGIQYHLCLDLDGTTGSLALGTTGFMVYVTPVTECWRCAIRPAQQQQLILSCPSCSGPASGYVESRNNSWNLSELVNFSVEELVKWLDVLPAYDFAPQVFLARSSCEKGPKRLRPKQSNAGCWENLTLGQVDLACSRSNGTSGDVSWEQEENSFEATLSHWSHLFVAVVDASGLVPGEEYLICLDLDGLGKPMPYGDTGLRTYVSPVTSAWVAGSFPRHLAVSQTSFTLEVSCEDLGTCLPYAWLWLDTSCSSRLSGAALEVQVLWPAQVTLDASGFQYGDLLHLCTDWGAVAGARPGSDTGFSIFVSPVDVVSPLAIEARADQIISISCVAGCRSATTVHLASHSCDTSSSTRASRSALLQSPQRLGLSTAELVWTAALDATDFQPGSSLLLCADMDGSGDTFAAGDTGVRIYVKGWASASMAIRAADAQQVLVSCLDCSAVTKIARAYVAEHCGRVQATEKTFPLVETTGGLAFLVDASMLTKGITARLCATLGEQTLPPFTDTALEIFVSPFSDIVPTRLTVGTGQIRLKCDHFVCPAETTWVRLATTCGQDAAEQLEVAAQSDAANSLVARFETSSLTAGRRYHVCIQVGTQPLGDTGRRIYLSNVSEVTPGSLRAAPAQEICFVCPQCSSAAMLRVAASCSDALEACLPWQRIHEINYTTEADFWNPSLSGVIHPDMLVLKNYDPYPGVLEAVANGTWSNETYSPPCARALRGTGGTVQMPLQPKSGATNGWCAILDGTPLETGVSYNLCLDLDGAGPLESGSVQEVFAAPDQMLSSGVEPSTVTQGVDIQRLRIGCALRCSEVTQAYLATSCEEALSRTAVARYLERLASRDGSAWLLPVNVSSFESGRHYKICIDLDGPSPGFLAGDSGLEVYVNGVVALDPLAVNQAAAQKIRFSCPTCAATATVSMYLARSTCTTHASDLPQLQLEGQRNLTLTLNAQSLEVGMSYRLCVDMDSGKAGDVGEIYVSPIVMTSFTLVWAAAARVVFECTFCRVESLVHLSADCQEPLSYPYPAGTLVQSTQRTLVANLFRDESDPSRLGVWWYADLQTEVLTAGLEYHLCLDLDGQGSLPAGDTGIPVFVNPVSELSQVVIRPALQSFNFVCSACEVGVAKLYLASTCSTPLTAQSTIYHDSPSRADTARRSALDASPLPKGRHYEVCVTASAVSAAVPAATLLLSPVEEVTPLVLRQVDTAQRLLLQCQGCSSLTVARLSSSCATGASGTESAALVLARSGMLADAGITNTAPTRTADGSYRAWWSLTVDATSLTAGLPHKICLDLDGLASVSHGFIDLEEQIYISPILQLKTSSIRAQQQQVLSFQCKVKCAGQFVGNPVLLLATQCDTSDFTGTARAVALRSTAAVPIRVDPVNQLAQPNGWYSAAIDASQLTVGQSYRICLDMDGSLKSLALGDSGLSVLVTA
ncbi:Hypothetical protein (Fragment) [Durusdinium trenchii]|uniref:Uncharacterized protein n=1 Tax=Durusdinium trenchii TaxID=1381693 RepID=A0ABP0LHK8_9DINO